MNIVRHLIISGRVQGVGYRAWVAAQAEKRRLDGWVRNRTDGRVEAVVSGAEDVVRDFLFACHVGPRMASVKRVEATPYEGLVARGFQVLPTF